MSGTMQIHWWDLRCRGSTSLHGRWPISPVRPDHSAPVSPSPVWKDKLTTATVSFAADVEVIVSTPVRSFPLQGPASHGQLRPSWDLSFSDSPVSPIPAPPGFTPIVLPGSFATLLVIMDSLPQDFPPQGSSFALFTLGLLSPRWVQPVIDVSGVACHPSAPSVCIPAVDSPVVSVLSLSPSAPPVPDVGSSPVVSLSGRSSLRLLSPDLERLDGSFYSAADSPT